MLNEEFLKRVIKRIERDQDRWDQNHWGYVESVDSLPLAALTEDQAKSAGVSGHQMLAFSDDMELTCGTSFCLAGHAVLEAGGVMLLHDCSGSHNATYCLTVDGEVRDIARYATELLGLDGEEGLFEAQSQIIIDSVIPEHSCNEQNDPDGMTACTVCEDFLDSDHDLTLDEFKTYLTKKTGVEFD